MSRGGGADFKCVSVVAYSVCGVRTCPRVGSWDNSCGLE